MKTILETKTDWLDAEVLVTYTEMTEGSVNINEETASIRVDKIEVVIGEDYLDITEQAKESFYKMLK
jgi:hypothetical protein